MKLSSIIAACLFCITPALADDCQDLSKAKKTISDHGGRWIDLTAEQFQFMRGAFYGNPMTADRLPFGDRAVLATHGDDEGGIIFFVDGDQACDPLRIATERQSILAEVGAGFIKHEEKGP